MMASGKIGSAELLAANRWYEAFAMAEHGAFDADKGGRSGGVKLFAQERQAAAATSYRMAREALGAAGDARMRLLMGDGLSIAALAKQIGQIPHMVAGMVAADLVRLVEHYTATPEPRRKATLH